MRLSSKFISLILLLLVLALGASYVTFVVVLRPEFDRQKEETWVSRSQQQRERVEALLRENLVTSRWLIRLVSDDGSISPPGPDLFRDSALSALSVFSQGDSGWKNLIELKKPDLDVKLEALAEGKDAQAGDFYFSSEGQTVVLRAFINDFQVVLAFPRRLLLEQAPDLEPILSIYDTRNHRVLLSSREAFSLPELVAEKIKSQPGVDLVDKLAVNSGDHLVSVSHLQEFPLALIAFGANARVEKTWGILLGQFLASSVLLMGIAVLLGWYFTRRMTSRLEALEETSKEIGAGNFSVSIDKSGSDEVAALAKGLSVMAAKIQDLFLAQEKQIRLESEMQLAQTVQSTLFPEKHSLIENYEVVGHYQSASECSGDLWGYWATRDSVFLYVLDATGHGVPAALMTSATRAVIALFEQFEKVGINQIVSGLNHILYRVGNQTHQATAFICQIEKATGFVKYINSSHVPVYIFPEKVDKKTKWGSIPVLSDPISSRLGESRDSHYTVGTYQLQKGETLVLLTDGLFDVVNSEGETFAERKAVKAMIDSMVESNSLQASFLSFVEKFDRFRSGRVMPDDVTLIWFRRQS